MLFGVNNHASSSVSSHASELAVEVSERCACESVLNDAIAERLPVCILGCVTPSLESAEYHASVCGGGVGSVGAEDADTSADVSICVKLLVGTGAYMVAQGGCGCK